MLAAFKADLTKRTMIKDTYVPFYLKWVTDCYAFLGQPTSELLSLDAKQHFLSHLAKAHQDWQVRQAEQALRLYSYFLSSTLQNSAVETQDAAHAWTVLENKTRETLRLRQRSYSTEKNVRGLGSLVPGLCERSTPLGPLGSPHPRLPECPRGEKARLSVHPEPGVECADFPLSSWT